MLELEVLVLKLVAIDYLGLANWASAAIAVRWEHTGLATGAITVGEVTALDHEVLDDTVESRSLITEALLASGESTEVLRGLGNSLAVKTKSNTSDVLVAVGNVEVDLMGDLGSLGGGSLLGEEDQADGEEQHGRGHEAANVEHRG